MNVKLDCLLWFSPSGTWRKDGFVWGQHYQFQFLVKISNNINHFVEGGVRNGLTRKSRTLSLDEEILTKHIAETIHSLALKSRVV